MAASHDTKFSFLGSHGGPGARRGHDYLAPEQHAPTRTQSLPQLGVPAGYSASLGNRLSHAAYANLRGAYHARLDVPHFENGGRRADLPPPREQKSEDWVAPERVRPETLPPAGGGVVRKRGKRLVGQNTNYISHVDTLIWGRDYDGSDGLLRQQDAPMYVGSAGVTAKAERIPIYGELPPTCVRTFGDSANFDGEGTLHYERRDPRADAPML